MNWSLPPPSVLERLPDPNSKRQRLSDPPPPKTLPSSSSDSASSGPAILDAARAPRIHQPDVHYVDASKSRTRNWSPGQNQEDLRLQTELEESRCRQEVERTRQEQLRLEQRRLEQSMLMDALRGGIPPSMIPLLFAGPSRTAASYEPSGKSPENQSVREKFPEAHEIRMTGPYPNPYGPSQMPVPLQARPPSLNSGPSSTISLDATTRTSPVLHFHHYVPPAPNGSIPRDSGRRDRDGRKETTYSGTPGPGSQRSNEDDFPRRTSPPRPGPGGVPHLLQDTAEKT